MKKTITATLALLFLFTFSLSAQRNWRMEASIGINTPTASYEDMTNRRFGIVSVEYYRFVPGRPFGYGAEGALYSAARINYAPGSTVPSRIGCRTFSASATADYFPLNADKVKIFIGAGLGLASQSSNGRQFFDNHPISFCATPRAGIILFRRVRITVEGRFSQHWFNTADLRVGYMF